MAPLTQEETEELSARILQELQGTPYACSSLIRLTKGTTNFVFRGYLITPLHDETSTITTNSVIIKHAAEFVAVNKDFLLDVSRSAFEESMLHAMNKYSPTTTDHISVKTPHLYLFNPEMNIQVIEDFQDTLDLETMLVTLHETKIPSQSIVKSVNRALGAWLRSFHTWTSAPQQSGLRSEVWKNEPMRKLKLRITYDVFLKVVENFPDILESHQETLEEVREMGVKEFEREPSEDADEDWGIIHGDFWSGNALIPGSAALAEQQQAVIGLYVVDWEFAQFAHRAYDLGQMIGDLYERKHFKGLDNALWAIQGFLQGYGPLSNELAFRTAIHAGVHLICWYTRRDPKTPPQGTPEQIHGGIKTGVDFIVKGWKKDRAWFENSPLAYLFSPPA